MGAIELHPHYSWQPLDLPKDKPRPMLSPLARATPFAGTLTNEDVQWLRIGAGRIDMDMKWMFRLGDDGVLRLFRSWTGCEFYRARVVKRADRWVLTDLAIESDRRRVGNHAQLADHFDAHLGACLGWRRVVANVPSSPEVAAAATIPQRSTQVPDLEELAWELDNLLPARISRLRMGGEVARMGDVLALKASVDHDCVRVDFAEGGHLWLRQPWPWSVDSSMFAMESGGALLWPGPGPQWRLEPDLAVLAAVALPEGVQVTKLSTSGKRLESRNNTAPEVPGQFAPESLEGKLTVTMGFIHDIRDETLFHDSGSWIRHLGELWRQVALLGSGQKVSQMESWQPPPRPAQWGPWGHGQGSDQREWAAWWAPAIHLLIYVLGCREPIAALTRRLDGEVVDDHEAWALLDKWWGEDLRGFAAWGLQMELDMRVGSALGVLPVERCGSLVDRPREWTRLLVEAGVGNGLDNDPLHLSSHALVPLEHDAEVEFTFEDDGRLVLIAPNFCGWYRALLEFEESADRPVEVHIADWGTLGTFARPAPGRLPRLVPTIAISPAQSTTHPTSAGLESFSPYVQEHVGWYVYLLRDPRNNEVFYVGKGKGNRVFAHARDAVALPDSDKPKLALIRAIHQAGLHVQTELVRHHIPNEKTAYLVEAAVLDAMASLGQQLSNEVGGHHSDLYGWASTAVAASIYEAPPMPDQAEPLLLLKIPHLWTPAMSDSALYEATRGWWVLAKKGLRARYAVAVNNGVTRGVFRIEYWRERVPGDRDYSPEDEGFRLGFQGPPAPEMAHLLNRSIKHLPQPSGGALIYINCNNPALANLPCHRGRASVEMAASETQS